MYNVAAYGFMEGVLSHGFGKELFAFYGKQLVGI